MNRIDNRPRGVLGYTLDNGILKDAIIDALWENHLYADRTREDLQSRIEPMTTVICYSDHSDEWALINGEGVGSYADRDGKAIVYFWIDTNYMFDVQIDYDTADGCMPGGEVDLADFIRVFGDRLDNNHRTWFNWAKFKPSGHTVQGAKAKLARKQLSTN
jgi:hypothetical protein